MVAYRTRNIIFDFEARLFYFMAYRKRNVVFGSRALNDSKIGDEVSG